MDSSLNKDSSPTEIPECITGSPQTNFHDSAPEVPETVDRQDHSYNPESREDASAGEKRKREDQDTALHPLWKTSLCSYFRRQAGSCSHGRSCRYAHGEEELRPRPDNTWDPTSERAKKAMKVDNGDKCEVRGGEVLMTEMVEDGDGEGGGDSQLSKCLVHLPRKWHSDNLRKFLSEQGVLFKSAKKKKGMVVGFVSFENEEQLQTAMEELVGKSIGNKNLKVADVIPQSFGKKVKSATDLPHNSDQTMEDASDKENAGVSVAAVEVEDGTANDDASASRAKSARDAVTPFAHMSYDDQLEHKKNSVIQNLKKLTRNARKACPNGVSLPEWILKSKEIGGLPCELEGVMKSPCINGYRNKCEFSVGYSQQGKPTVGFMLGNFREGVTAVEEPTGCPNVSTIACKYASIFQEFLQNSSFPIWNRFKNTGFWRQLTVREGRSAGKVPADNSEGSISEVMLIVQVCSVGFDDAQITSEFERLAHSFTVGATANSPNLPLTALVVQDHQGISNAAPADAPLHWLPIPNTEGRSEQETVVNAVEARIHEYISGLRFSISPTAFFQVNTLAAEKLYSLAGDWAQLSPDTLLFDICCGTGTIGLTLAHRVGLVIGIEMNASAVADAHRNAEINGIKNCRFVCAKAEDVMGSLLKEYLNMSEKQDQLSVACKSAEETISPEEKKDPSVDNTKSAEESSCCEPQNHKDLSGSSQNGEEELQIQLQKSTSSKDENSLMTTFKNVVAIVDPPRMGLHPIVIKALRTHPCLQRLVYISCNPESLVANAIELCTPSPPKLEKGKKDNRGWRNMSSAGLARHRVKSMPISEPFRPVKAMAVDLFPHTPHCEMVMLLER
ncbi:hypothetical protein SLE2022_285080 [Rubroshorea leprosula]